MCHMIWLLRGMPSTALSHQVRLHTAGPGWLQEQDLLYSLLAARLQTQHLLYSLQHVAGWLAAGPHPT
jgi:hypothetical protein